jgi:hypothetical protein
MEAIVLGETPPPSSRRDDIPESLDAIVMKLLAKSPDDRYQTAEELLEIIDAEAVRSGSSLSTSNVARFVRELFGRRPEPWIELREEHVEGVTVTTEPVPDEISIPIADGLSRDLAILPDFSTSALRRSADIPEVGTGLRTAYNKRASSKSPVKAGDVPPTKSFTYSPADIDDLVPRPRRRRRAMALGLGAAAVLAAGAFAVMTVTTDAAAPHHEAKSPATPDATSLVAMQITADAVEVDAIEVTTPPIDARAPVDAQVRPGPRSTTELVAEVARAFEDNRFADAVAGCGNASVLARSGAVCVLAACKLHETARAQRWLTKVASRQRADVVSSCEAAGVSFRVGSPVHVPVAPPDAGVVTPPPTPKDAAPVVDCKIDPLACQH